MDMNIIDTHSHIYQPDFDNDIEDVILRAKQAGVINILLPNIDVESINRVTDLSNKYAGYCLPMMGLHPTSVSTDWKSDLNTIKTELKQGGYIAVGEIGIDLYWDKSLVEEQKQAFEEQLRWSADYNLPVVIHSRDAITECIECVKNVGEDNLRGVFHSFGGTSDELEAVLALQNFYIGINGVVTFKNSGLSTVLKVADLSRIVLETDAPYLSPVPYRGKRNESSYVLRVAECLSNIYGVSLAEVAHVTTRNAKKIFGI